MSGNASANEIHTGYMFPRSQSRGDTRHTTSSHSKGLTYTKMLLGVRPLLIKINPHPLYIAIKLIDKFYYSRY